MLRYISLLSLIFLHLHLFAQTKNPDYRLNIRQAVTPVQIDGMDDEAAWQVSDSTSPFFMVLPMDTSLAEVKTMVKMTYDSHNLYLLAVCYNDR
ncbi:MAG: hydrolase, partial [Bacteroidota bacterium]|nr:hydrolase [Bacteroidota bacterium]